MFYRRKTYRVTPDQVAPFTAFFEQYLLPNQLKQGARLVGRWVTEAQDEIVAMWEYESREEFLTPTGHYHMPRHILAASACITNERGEVLLVRTHVRADTWELPGGQVEVGEAPHVAAQREVLEETGVEVRITGLVGSYYNEIRSIANLLFRGEYLWGVPTTSNETPEVGFFPPEEALARMTRPHFRIRLEDALAGRSAPYETFRPGGERNRLGKGAPPGMDRVLPSGNSRGTGHVDVPVPSTFLIHANRVCY